LKLANPSAFKAAHDKLVKKSSQKRGNRPVAFGTYDIGGGENISHWEAISASNFSDLMDQKVLEEKYVKEWAEWTKIMGAQFLLQIIHLMFFLLTQTSNKRKMSTF
tara:strand:+ start:62 stop:379 length:318 start_codon:yes stop_codon:yes gene_type:complete